MLQVHHKKWNKIGAWLIIIAMMGSLLPPGAWAKPPEPEPAWDALNNYVVEFSSDPATSTKPATFGTAADDGRVWVDKSVSVNGTQFDVTLSALAQEYVLSSESEVKAQAAADVVMILDMSGSMTSSRVSAMTNAVNTAIDIIMAANPRNRIGIYYYSGTSASTLFPIAAYSTAQTGDNTDAKDRYMTSNNTSITRKAGITQKILDKTTNTWTTGSTTNLTVSTSSGTGTQLGLYTGITDLINDATGRTLSNEDTARVPYVLLLTDGEANRAYANWYNSPLNGTSYSSPASTISALTILTATKLKDELKTTYTNLSGGKDVVWFNVAFGLSEGNNYATSLLKPSRLASATSGDEKSVYTQLTSLTNDAPESYKKYGVGGTPGYLYASDYIYFISSNDLNKVDDAIGDLAALVEAATQEKIIPIEQENEFGDPLHLVVTDVLGAGMQLISAPKLNETT